MIEQHRNALFHKLKCHDIDHKNTENLTHKTGSLEISRNPQT